MCSDLAVQQQHLPLCSWTVCVSLLNLWAFRIVTVMLLTDPQLSAFIMLLVLLLLVVVLISCNGTTLSLSDSNN